MKSLSLRTKLFMLSGFLLAISMVLGGIGFWSTNAITKDYSVIAKVNMPNVENLNKMILNVRQARVELLQVTMPGTTPEQDEESVKEIAEQFKQLDQTIVKYKEVPFGPGEEVLFKRFEDDLTATKKHFDHAISLHQKSHDENSAERAELRRLISGDIRTVSEDLRQAGAALSEYHEKWANGNVAGAESVASHASMLSILTIIMGFLSGGALSYIFSNGLVKNLRHIIESISDSSTQVSAAAGQIASSSEELSQAATEQAASLEETAASIEEMNSMVSKNRENAKSTATVSTDSEQTASKGREAVDQMISSMNEINRSNEQISEIVKVINEIGSKTKVINDIVFQTKLLSFNASVEAARAGEHGKGFAVVAEEVGNLAQMSGNAAKEISNLLESSIHKVEAIVQETKAKVEAGTLTAQQCGEILSEIVSNVSKVASMASEISTASEEQSRGVQEITKAMNQLDQVTQTNAATSEEAASAAEELSAQADSLKSLVMDLTYTVNGRHDNASGAPAYQAPKVKPVSPASAPEKKGKVIHLRKNAPASDAPAPAFKRAAGGDATPDYDDSRFKDV